MKQLSKYWATVLTIGFFLLLGCSKTPDADYLPKPLGYDQYPPWEAPVYSYEEMLTFFPDTDYSGLMSVYVSTTGSDEYGDGSMANPYRSIQYAIDDAGAAGVIVRVLAGTYLENVIVDVEATQSSPFVVYSEDGMGAAKIDGQFNSDETVRLNGQYCILDGFEAYNSNRYCITVFRENVGNPYGGGNSYCVVRNNIAHDSKQDVVKVSHADFVMVEGNDLYGALQTVQEDQCIDGVAVYHSVCRYNYMHDNGAGGGGYFKAGSHNNIWCYNYIENMVGTDLGETRGFGIMIGGGGQFSNRDQAFYEYPSAHEQDVFNNVMINCAGSAVVVVSGWNSRIYNNTFYNCGYEQGNLSKAKGIVKAAISTGNNDTGVRSTNIEIRNNVSYNASGFEPEHFFNDHQDEFTGSNLFHSHNTVYDANGLLVWNYPDAANASEQMADPLFNDPINCDYSVMVGSPIIDAGMTLNGVLQGLSGLDCYTGFTLVNRPLGAAYDRGAYEQ